MNPDPTSLDRLHDIVSPPPAAWWPPAPGWRWVLALAAVLLAWLAVRAFVRWQRNRYRRESLAELRRCESDLRGGAPPAEVVRRLSELLKRTALSVWPRPEVAPLTGDAWLQFLDATGATKDFTAGPGQWLATVSYDSRRAGELSADSVNQLADVVRQWIRRHQYMPREVTP